MRGIGVGIFIAALILIVARINTPADISDAEIISRAHELGMIESDSMSLTESAGNTDVQESSSSELYPVLVPTGNNETDPASSVSSDDGESPADLGTEGGSETDVQPGSEEQSGTDVQSEPEAQPEPEVTPDPEVTPEPEVIPEPDPQPAQTDYYVLTVERGNSSNVVAEKLERLGAIDDAKAFDRYLVDNGYANRISVGTFQIPSDSSYEWIAKKITNSL